MKSTFNIKLPRRLEVTAVHRKIDPSLAYQLAVKHRSRLIRTFGMAAIVVLSLFLGYNIMAFYSGEPGATYRLYSYRLINQEKAIPVLVLDHSD